MGWLKKHLDERYLKICAYAGVTALLVVAAILLLYHSGAVLGGAWSLGKAILQPIIWGALICYILLPVVRWFDARLAGRGFIEDDTRRLYASVAITFALLAAIIVGLVALLLLVITRSLESVTIETLRSILDSMEGDVMELLENIRMMAEELGISLGGDTAEAITGAVSKVTGGATTVVFSIIFGIYFLLDGEGVARYFKRLFNAILGGRTMPDLSFVVEDANDAFSGYIRGQFVDALVVGMLTTLVFAIIDVPYWPIIGMLTGMGNLIPYVGGPVGFGATIIVCLVEGDFGKLAAGVIALAVVMFVDSNVINPRLLSEAVEVHPLLVVAALIAGSAIGGIAGMLVAVPTAALIKAELDRWIALREAAMGDGSEAGEQPRHIHGGFSENDS